MKMKIRIKKWNGQAWEKKLLQGLSRNMDAAAITLQGYIITKISEGQPASAPGEPPHVLFGGLRRSIGWQRNSALSRSVGSGIGGKTGVPYPLFLEFGTGKMAPRPYLRSSLYEMQKELINIMLTPVEV